MRVGLCDSGLGGIAILKEVRKRYPNNDYVYIGDNKNLPYGNKSKDEFIKRRSCNCNRFDKEKIRK